MALNPKWIGIGVLALFIVGIPIIGRFANGTATTTPQYPSSMTTMVLDNFPKQYGRTFPIYEDSAMVPRRFIPDGGQPILTMYNAYRLYGFVQFCYQARKGYLVVNINEIEMQRATQAIKLVERKLSFGNADREAIWQRAVKANNGMTEGQNACEEVYRELLRYSGMPNYNPQRP